MDLTQIRYFLALSQTLNFTRAAELCNVSQPALTRSIQRLEVELGGPLILRERSYTQLTELGRTMLPLLTRTSEAADAVRVQAALVRRGSGTSPLRIGIAPTVSLDNLLPLLREVGRRVNGLELELQDGPVSTLVERLLTGELDTALLPEVEALPERLNRWLLYRERVILAVPHVHPLASLPEIPASALDGQDVLGYTDSGHCGLGLALARLRSQVGIRPRVSHRGSSEAHVSLMVAAGLGMALVLERKELLPGAVARLLVSPTPEYPVVLAVAAGRPMNRAVIAFTKLARAISWTV